VSDRARHACGVLWRPEFARVLDPVLASRQVDVVEVMFEDLLTFAEIPPSLAALKRRGATILVHGATLSLGGAERPDMRRVRGMARIADMLDAPLVSEHLAFVRSGGREAWHLLPLPRTRQAVDVLAENLDVVRSAVDRPVALENIAYLFEWPGNEMSEAEFIRTVIGETGSLLLLDVENVRVNACNYEFSAEDFLAAMPLDRLAYVHVAGGEVLRGVHRDTHSERVPPATLRLLELLSSRTEIPHLILERDQNLPAPQDLANELRDIDQALARGLAQRRWGSRAS
jgi:uncharacterized protein (UPF0276 family)